MSLSNFAAAVVAMVAKDCKRGKRASGCTGDREGCRSGGS